MQKIVRVIALALCALFVFSTLGVIVMEML